MIRRHPIISFLSLSILLLTAACSFGAMIVRKGGHWPRNWPAALEPFRTRATTGSFSAGAQATYYYIEFETREEFEGVWPSLLKLKSKGAPLNLRTVDLPRTDPNDRSVRYTKPQVAIQCPAGGSYQEMPDGRYSHFADWTPDIEPLLTDGVLPMLVGKDSTGKWTTDPNSWVLQRGFYLAQHARVTLTLYTDGEVIDLNRIRLPQNTPIMDYRKLERYKDSGSKSDR